MWQPVRPLNPAVTTTPAAAQQNAAAPASPSPEPATTASSASQTSPGSSAAPPQPDPHAVVRRCYALFHQAYAAEVAAKSSESRARDKAKAAYRAAMPPLISRSEIRSFIACIAQGMILGVFWNDEGPKLTAVAKAALASLPRESRPVGRPSSQQES
jgi:hypothetical protein